MNNKFKFGFTLLETIIYIALFSFIFTGVILSVYEIFSSEALVSVETATYDEASFVIQKISALLENATAISVPSTGYSDSLSFIRYTSSGTEHIDIRLVDTHIELRRGSNSFVPLTSNNVVVTSLSFYHSSGSMREIQATTTINAEVFSLTRYFPI